MEKQYLPKIGASLLVVGLAAISVFQLLRSYPKTYPSEGALQFEIALLNSGQWRFVVSGDSRNCGDIVMPSIAAHSSHYAPSFYWHLGDLRAIYKTDEDMEGASAHEERILTCSEYHRRAWHDFIDSQIGPFSGTPFFVGIGNHEVIQPKDQNQFISQFSNWLSTSLLNSQRRNDGEKDPDIPRTYYHWLEHGVDFINLDNSSGSFSKEQLDWFDGVVKRAEDNPKVLSLVVGMHEALPDSIASSHAMCDDPKKVDSCSSGRHVYDILLGVQTHKPVYVLASHSHFYMNSIFDNHPPAQRLQGWIVGTAGAIRYALPQNAPPGAVTDVYGYLLGTVGRDGGIRFEFKKVNESDVPKPVRERYPLWLVPWCFAHNSQNVDPSGEETSHRCMPPS